MKNIGDVINTDDRRYRIIDIIGRGASCIAYLAERSENSFVSKCILKEYAPQNTYDFEDGKKRFIDSGKRQNQIRQYSCLNNQTPPVSNIFEADGTAYIDVSCYNGTTLDKLSEISPAEFMRICRTVANTVKYYHKMGFLCLDLKPENIFIMQNAPDDTITQIVEFIDFDSIREIGSLSSQGISYTREWAAPEQMNIYSGEISYSTDIYTLGEIVFYQIFGRHSEDNEHRGFSKYPFDKCQKYEKYITRPEVQSLFAKLFRNTLRSSPKNRFPDMESVVKLIDKIVEELENKEFIIPLLPPVTPNFVGRDNELKEISKRLETNNVLFINGVGGIGKSTLIRKFIHDNQDEYEVMLYLEYEGDIKHTISDDDQIHISTISRYSGESIDDYYERKITAVKNICSGKKVLLVIDNFTDRVTKELNSILSIGYDTIVVTRNNIPKNSYPVMTIEAIENKDELHKLISIDLGRQMSKEEKKAFDNIIELTEGHTLVIELIARQISSGCISAMKAVDLIKKEGFTHYSYDKIGNIKDGEEVYATIGRIISELFKSGNMPECHVTALKTLALLGVRGFETKLFCDILKVINIPDLLNLSSQGWIYFDDRVRVHPVIAEAVRMWDWNDLPNEQIMELYGSIVDIYSGLNNAEQIKTVIKNAKEYVSKNPLHYNIAVYYDMWGTYYDVMLGGGYVTENRKEEYYLDKMLTAIEKSIRHTEKVSCADNKLLKLYFSQASVLIRSYPQEKKLICDILRKSKESLKKEDNENICYFYMTNAWYYTLCEKKAKKTADCLNKAFVIAKKAFPTELELIDIFYIPAANCLYYHFDYDSSIAKLNEAVKICEKYPNALSYIDKKAEILNCMLDVYFEMQDHEKCSKIIAAIDEINDQYEARGIYREVSENIREQVK